MIVQRVVMMLDRFLPVHKSQCCGVEWKKKAKDLQICFENNTPLLDNFCLNSGK